MIALAIVIITLVTTIDYVCFNPKFYAHEFDKLNISVSSSLSQEDLENSMNVLLDYLSGQRDDMVVYGTVDDEYREVFNQREKDHMVDVRALYIMVNQLMIGAVITVFICLGILLLKHCQNIVSAIYNSYRQVLFGLLIFLAAVGLLCWLDFNSFWTQFHLLFFRNDLWLLDPKTDVLIRMVPEAFFLDLVSIVAIIFGILNILIFVLLKLIKRRDVKQL